MRRRKRRRRRRRELSSRENRSNPLLLFWISFFFFIFFFQADPFHFVRGRVCLEAIMNEEEVIRQRLVVDERPLKRIAKEFIGISDGSATFSLTWL